MTIDFHQFVKDISKIDLEDICSDWQWLLKNQYTPIIVSCAGDIFLVDKNESISWLDTGAGQLQKIADNLEQFNSALENIENIDKWFQASIVLELIEKGMILLENQVYSYKLMPILSGDYSPENFELTDMSVHFSFTGQICKQVKDLPEGTRINKFILRNNSDEQNGS